MNRADLLCIGCRDSQAGFSHVPDGCVMTGLEAAPADGSNQPCDGCSEGADQNGRRDCYSTRTWHAWPGARHCDTQGRVLELDLDGRSCRCDGLRPTECR